MLVTGFDIIFFWVARMIMMGLKFMGDVPFSDVYITGLIRDENGEKMSKSKGNVIDPLDIIDGIALEDLVAKRTSGLMQPQLRRTRSRRPRASSFPKASRAFGTDALRFTFASLAGPSRDINFDLGRVGGYRNFCNKLWNARALRADDCRKRRGPGDLVGAAELSVADRWIVSRLRGHARAGGPARSPTIASTSRRRRCTNSPGTSSATGTSSSPSRCCRAKARPTRRSAARAARW